MTTNELIDGVIKFFALLGSGLGIYNLVIQLRGGRVRLKVKPKPYLIAKPHMRGLAIEVVNLSPFDVTVESVGLLCKDKSTLVATAPLLPGYNFELPPFRLQARDRKTVFLPPGLAKTPKLSEVLYAFADVSTGEHFTGTNSSLRRFISGALYARDQQTN